MSGRPTSAERAALLAIAMPNTSYAQAAASLGISDRALESRLRRLYRRLNVSTGTQAAIALSRLDSATGVKTATQGGVHGRRFPTEVASSR